MATVDLSRFKALDNAQGVVEVSKELVDYAREVVPPIYGLGCFFMGQAIGHTEFNGGKVFYAFTRLPNGKFYGYKGTVAHANHIFTVLRKKGRSVA